MSNYCVHCGQSTDYDGKFCPNCGAPMEAQGQNEQTYVDYDYKEQSFGDSQGTWQDSGQTSNYNGYPVESKSKIAAGLFGIFLGGLGIHKFYLGYTKEGIIMLLVSLLTCGVGASVMAIIGLIEGILYLTKSDVEFTNIYVYGRKGWF